MKIEIIYPSLSHKSSDYDFQVLCVTITSPLFTQMFYMSGFPQCDPHYPKDPRPFAMGSVDIFL